MPKQPMSEGASEDHEALCRRCGRCCVEKIMVNGAVFSTTRLCRFLDPRTRLCTVYEQRFRANPHCLDVERGMAYSVFPPDCPYVLARPTGYRPPRPEVISEQVERMLDSGEIQSMEELLEAVKRHPARVDPQP